MTVAVYKTLNNAVDTFSAYKSGIDGNSAVLIRLGVMFAPHAQTVADMTVRLDAGHIFDGVTLTEVAAQSTGTITAPVSNPRIDRIVIDKTTGAVSVVTGTPAVSPVAPAIPSGKCPVAQIALTNVTTAIANSLITDERDFTGLGGQSTQTPYGVSTNVSNAYSVTTSPTFASIGTGTRLFVKINAANTGSVTLNPNAIGATAVKDNFGNNITKGTFAANSIYEFLYDGTNFILLNNSIPFLWLPYAADTGAADAYVVQPAPAPPAYASGMGIRLKPANANTGASTVNVAAISTKNIKLLDGTDPWANAMITTGIYDLVYDGTNMILLNPSPRAFVGDTGSGGAMGMVPAPASGDAAAGRLLGADGTWNDPPTSGVTVFDGNLSNVSSQNFSWTAGAYRSMKISLRGFAQSGSSGITTSGLLRLINNSVVDSTSGHYENNMETLAEQTVQLSPSGTTTIFGPNTAGYERSNAIVFTGTSEVPYSNGTKCCIDIEITCMDDLAIFKIVCTNPSFSAAMRKFTSSFLVSTTLISGIQLLLSSGSRAFSTNTKCTIIGYP